ncbi:unnamed protein product [Peniophora sp. CBMAI 1063]|nr:unnamed protein product [Peniophora sp. CBMAI 1063]
MNISLFSLTPADAAATAPVLYEQSLTVLAAGAFSPRNTRGIPSSPWTSASQDARGYLRRSYGLNAAGTIIVRSKLSACQHQKATIDEYSSYDQQHACRVRRLATKEGHPYTPVQHVEGDCSALSGILSTGSDETGLSR